MFGATRCMFGSNFPVESLWTTYGELVNVFAECLEELSPAERRLVWHDNAARLYRIDAGGRTVEQTIEIQDI